MTRRTIVIILVITAIIAAVAFTTLKKEKTIEGVFLSDTYDIKTENPDEEAKEPYGFASSSDIYVVILLENITVDDKISIQWKKIIENGELLVQEDTIIEKQEGSGPLIISLSKKNNIHEEGTYRIYVQLNDQNTIERSFTVKEE